MIILSNYGIYGIDLEFPQTPAKQDAVAKLKEAQLRLEIIKDNLTKVEEALKAAQNELEGK